MAIKQIQDQRLTQHLSPLQIQMIKLLELNTMDMQLRIRREIEENPVLDEDMLKKEEEDEKGASDVSIDNYKEDDTPGYRMAINTQGKDEKGTYDNFSVRESFSQSLLNQLGYCNLDDHLHQVASFIICSLDSRGYLLRDIDSLVDDMAFKAGIETDTEEVLKAISTIQDFEPAGVCARDLRECLLLQMRDAPHNEINDNARRILTDFFDPFANRHWEKIISRTGMTKEQFKEAVARIRRLNPSPGGQIDESYADRTQQINPDFTLTNDDGKLKLEMPRFKLPELKIKREYSEILETAETTSERSVKEAASFVRQKLDAAKWFVEAIKQRHNTLMATMQAIIDLQVEYFTSGDISDLKPMVLKDVAAKTGFDISTISRVVNSKFIETPFGIFSLKSFFSEGLENAEGEEVSTRELKKALQELIDSEDKTNPLTDDQLVTKMTERGYKVARRTIAKYRDQLGIPTARLRKGIE